MVRFKDIRNEKKERQNAKEMQIVAEYKRGCKERPDLSRRTIIKAIAPEFGYKSEESVKLILRKHNLYESNRAKCGS